MLKLSQNKGFLLFEAMVAVAVLSLGITLTLNSFFSIIDAARVSQDYIIASSLIEAKMFQLETGEILETEVQSGDFGEGYKDYSWVLKSKALEDASLNEVTLTVAWERAEKLHDLDVVTYLKR